MDSGEHHSGPFRGTPFRGTFRCKFRNPLEFYRNGKHRNKEISRAFCKISFHRNDRIPAGIGGGTAKTSQGRPLEIHIDVVHKLLTKCDISSLYLILMCAMVHMMEFYMARDKFNRIIMREKEIANSEPSPRCSSRTPSCMAEVQSNMPCQHFINIHGSAPIILNIHPPIIILNVRHFPELIKLLSFFFVHGVIFFGQGFCESNFFLSYLSSSHGLSR